MNPPKVARTLLNLTLPPNDREDVLDNLDELYRSRSETRGRTSANAWYWRQALTFAARVRLGSPRPGKGTRQTPSAPNRAAQFVEDVRFSVRSLRRAPGFLLAVVGTLSLGLGVNITTFAVVNSAILRPLPFPDADDLIWLWPSGNVSLTLEQFTELQPGASVADLTAFAFRGYSIQGDQGSSVVSGISVSTNHFDVFGIQPSLGRPFGPEDAQPGSEAVALISHELWQTHFGADSTIVGKRVDLFTAASIPMVRGAFAGTRHTIVGVLEPLYSPFGFSSQVYTPLVLDPADPNFSNMGELTVVGRMTGATTPSHVQSELIRLSSEMPSFARMTDLQQEEVIGLRAAVLGTLPTTMLLTLGAVGLVLLIACANVANLLLGRTQARQREFSIRRAVGAGSGRLVRQLLTESLVLSIVSVVVGLSIAYLLLPPVAASLPPHVAPPDGVALDWRVLWFVTGALVFTTFVAGVAPAALNGRSGGAGLAGSSRTSGKGRLRHRINHALIVGEIALAVVLTHGAGLLVTSFTKLTRVDPGFSTENVMALQASPTSSEYKNADVRRGLFAQILEQSAAIPGVESVGAIHFLPIADGGPAINFLTDPADTESRRDSGYRVVTPGYIETMSIPVLDGRAIDDTDLAGGPLVGMINRSLAEALWPGERAIGKTIYRTNGRVMMTVVGVVGDVRQSAVGLPPAPEIYIPLSQTEWASGMNVVVRTAGPIAGLDQQLRSIVGDIDPNLPVTRVAWMDTIVSGSVADWRFYGLLFTAFAALALFLGGVGVYGVVSSVVTERTDEIGICLALGATRDGILRREVVRGGGPIVLGLLVGLLLSIGGTRLVASLLFEISSFEPMIMVASSFALALVGLAAVAIPARRASRIDPLVAIRSGE